MNPENPEDAADPYERLLRWYPRAWREAHGQVLLALLRDGDDDAGRTRPTGSDAWAVRLHGTAERLTPTAGWALSTAGALASLVVVVNVFALLGASAPPPSTAWGLVLDPAALVPLCASAASPALVGLGGVALLRRGRVLTDPAAVLAGATSCAAWLLGALASGLAGVELHRADADLAASPASAAALPLFVVACAVGTVAAAVAWDGALAVVPALCDGRGRSGPRVLVRRVLATMLGAPTALLLGLGSLVPGAVFLVGTAVAATCLHRSRRASSPSADGPRSGGRRRPPLVADGRRASAAGQLAVAGLALGAVGLALLALGPVWREQLLEKDVLLTGLWSLTDGMLLSRLGAALTSVAVGLVLVPRWTLWTRLVVGAVCTALLLEVLSAVALVFVRPDGDAGLWPLLTGGLLVGLATASALPGVLPGRAVVRWSASALLGAAAGLTAGAGFLALVPVLAPLAAGAVLLALLVSAARVRRPAPGSGPAPTGATARP